jgi:hypothetical protein
MALDKPEDKIDVSEENYALVFTITSPSGIDGGAIKTPGGISRNAYVRFQHGEGKRYLYLENYTISSNNCACDLSIHYGFLKGECCSVGENSKCIEDTRIKEGECLWKVDCEYLEIPVPQELIDAEPEYIEMDWVDAYRG